MDEIEKTERFKVVSEMERTHRYKRFEYHTWTQDGKEHRQIRTSCVLCKTGISFDYDPKSFLDLLYNPLCEKCKIMIKKMGYAKKN